MDEQKAQNLGVQWLNVLHVAENSVPSLFHVGTLGRDAIFADLSLPQPDHHLGVGSGSHAEQTGKVMIA